ncbi:MAG: hypothetical protein ACI4VF_06475 [Lachnospirales bacterium]
MEIDVNTYYLECLSEEFRNIGNNFSDIITEYNTLSYEILNEIETESEEDIKTAADELKKAMDNGFITIKKHENFLINTYQDYSLIDKKLSDEAIALVNMLYQSGSGINMTIVPTPSNILLTVNPIVLPLVIDKLPNTDISRVNVNNRKSIVITGLIDAIVSESDAKFSYLRAMMGIIGLIAPAAILTGLYGSIIPDERVLQNILGLTDEEDVGSGASGNGTGKYDSLLELIGQGFQTNYNLIEALYYSFIIASLLDGNIVIGELSGYDTLADITYTNKVNEYVAEDDENLEYKENYNNKNNDENIAEYGDYFYNTKVNKDAEHNDSIYSSFRNNEYEELYKGNLSSMEEADKLVRQSAEQLTPPEVNGSENIEAVNDEASSDDLNSSLGLGGGSAGGGSSLGGGLGDSSSFSANSDAVSAYTQNPEEVISKGNFNAEYNKIDTLYGRILSSVYNKNSDVNTRSLAAMTLGGGAAAAGGIGTIFNLAQSTVAANTEADMLKHIAGALSFNNIFELVGNAQMCNIGWLSEIKNVLV